MTRNPTLGILTAVASTLLDSLSGFFQLEPRKHHNPSPFMFMYVISFHTCYLAIIFCLLTGEYSRAAHLLTSSEDAWKDQVLLTLTNVMGLVFIFVGLGLLGPIKLAFITSSRKAISVLASIVAFNKAIDNAKLVGIFLILGGMVAENLLKEKKGHHGHHHSHKHADQTMAETGGQASNPKKANVEREDGLRHREK